jgi:hypothetical protein
MSGSTAGLTHRKLATAAISCDTCRVLGHDKRNILYFCEIITQQAHQRKVNGLHSQVTPCSRVRLLKLTVPQLLKKIHTFLWKQNVCNLVYSKRSLVFIVRQTNSVHTLPYYFVLILSSHLIQLFKGIHFVNIFQPKPSRIFSLSPRVPPV